MIEENRARYVVYLATVVIFWMLVVYQHITYELELRYAEHVKQVSEVRSSVDDGYTLYLDGVQISEMPTPLERYSWHIDNENEVIVFGFR